MTPFESISTAFRYFFVTVPGSIRGHVNLPELIQVMMIAPAAAGTVVGMTAYLAQAATKFIPNPEEASLATLVLTAVGAVAAAVAQAQKVLTRGDKSADA